MRVALGERVVAQSPAPAAPLPNMGARVEAPYTRQILSYWRPVNLVDGFDAVGNPALLYETDLDPLNVAGDFLLVFMTGDAEPQGEVFYPLVVT